MLQSLKWRFSRARRAIPEVLAGLAVVPLRRMIAPLAQKLAQKEFRNYGNGDNRARLPFAAQPRALQVGDQLVSGDYVLEQPRDGFNGSVILKITGGLHGHEIEVPARLPIAIWPKS